MVSLYKQQYVIKRNLPGQRMGAKAWYWLVHQRCLELFMVCGTALFWKMR